MTMMLEGFTLGADGISFEKEEQHLDLHNNYDFKSLGYDVADRRLWFAWKLSDGDWVSENLPKALLLVLSGVYLFKVRERNPKEPFTEDSCLESIGFIWNNMTDQLEGYTKHLPEAECNHLNLNFQSSFAVKVGAEKATLIVPEETIDLKSLKAFRTSLNVQTEKSGIVEARQGERH